MWVKGEIIQESRKIILNRGTETCLLSSGNKLKNNMVLRITDMMPNSEKN